MSATGTPTTNLALRIMNGTDPVDVADINANSQTLDSKIGAIPSGKNVKGMIDSNTTSTDNLRSSIAIVANGNTHDAISSGQYVYVMNHNTLTDGMYVATANIATNATLSLSNLDALSSGVANGLKSEITALNSKVSTHEISGSTVSDIQSALVTYGNSLGTNEKSNIKFAISTASGVFESATYFGTIQKVASNRFIVLANGGTNPSQDIEGVYYSNAWVWQSMNANMLTYKLSKSSASAHSFTVPNSSRHFIIFTSTSAACLWVGYVQAASGGALTINEIVKGNGVTVTSSTNTITFTIDQSRVPDVAVATIYGGKMS